MIDEGDEDWQDHQHADDEGDATGDVKYHAAVHKLTPSAGCRRWRAGNGRWW